MPHFSAVLYCGRRCNLSDREPDFALRDMALDGRAGHHFVEKEDRWVRDMNQDGGFPTRSEARKVNAGLSRGTRRQKRPLE